MKSLVLAMALLLPCEALAQTTRCGNEFGQWVCHTDPPRPDIFQSGMDAFNKGLQQGAQIRRQREEAQAAADAQAQVLEQQRRFEHQRAIQDQVIAAIREHRCGDAKDIALANSDLNLADQAQRLCTQTP